MPFLDSILPATLDPMVKHVINFLVGVHLIVFLVFVYLLCKSLRKSPQDNFREQYQKMEKKVEAKKNKNKVE